MIKRAPNDNVTGSISFTFSLISVEMPLLTNSKSTPVQLNTTNNIILNQSHFLTGSPISPSIIPLTKPSIHNHHHHHQQQKQPHEQQPLPVESGSSSSSDEHTTNDELETHQDDMVVSQTQILPASSSSTSSSSSTEIGLCNQMHTLHSLSLSSESSSHLSSSDSDAESLRSSSSRNNSIEQITVVDNNESTPTPKTQTSSINNNNHQISPKRILQSRSKSLERLKHSKLPVSYVNDSNKRPALYLKHSHLMNRKLKAISSNKRSLVYSSEIGLNWASTSASCSNLNYNSVKNGNNLFLSL